MILKANKELKQKDFKNEKELQNFFENNIEAILGYKFIDTEFVVGDFRIDSLAFDEESKSFRIIEYKNVKNHSLVDQGYTYLKLMLERKADFVLQYNIKTNSSLTTQDIDWSQSRIIFVSPIYTAYQLNATDFKNIPVDLVKVTRYEDDIIEIDFIKKTSNVKVQDIQMESIQNDVNKEIIVYTEEDHLSKVSDNIKRVYEELKTRILELDHNLIYQNLRILVGHKFLNKWIRSNEFMIDYFEEFKEELENKYGVEDKKKIIDLLAEISVLLEVKYNPQKAKEYREQKEKLQEELEELENKEEYIEKVTNQKINLTEKIKKIDTIINNKELLEKKYKERNEKLPLEQKIFSIRILSQKMQEERDECFKEIDKLNEILNPQNFIKHKKGIENKYKYLKVLDEKEKLEKLKLNFQKIFLKIMKKEISKAETKQDIEKIIYDFRYYMMIPYDNNILVQKNEKLQKDINETSELIIAKANELKTIEKISNDKSTNDEILKNIFKVRIIKLEDAYLKITKEKERYFVQIFDENIFEEKIEISKPKDLEIKLNKKIPIWIH